MDRGIWAPALRSGQKKEKATGQIRKKRKFGSTHDPSFLLRNNGLIHVQCKRLIFTYSSLRVWSVNYIHITIPQNQIESTSRQNELDFPHHSLFHHQHYRPLHSLNQTQFHVSFLIVHNMSLTKVRENSFFENKKN